jgi:hypothetical protein
VPEGSQWQLPEFLYKSGTCQQGIGEKDTESAIHNPKD